ncbi:MAG TPA: hypothetical protein VGO47_00720, partial [Chlamydiales bacterium]|nr:hypothetical protein [Chlamydiales bacterium]
MNASISKHPTLKPLISKSTPQEREEMIQAIMLDAEYDLEKLKRAMAKASGSGGLLHRKKPRQVFSIRIVYIIMLRMLSH